MVNKPNPRWAELAQGDPVQYLADFGRGALVCGVVERVAPDEAKIYVRLDGGSEAGVVWFERDERERLHPIPAK